MPNKKNLSILVSTYHEAYLRTAGGEFELISTADSLRAMGIIADIYGPYARSIDHYDAVLHFSIYGGSIRFLQKVAEANKPIILWPNAWIRDGHPSTDINEVNQMVQISQFVVFKSSSELENFRTLYTVEDSKVVFVKVGVDPVWARLPPEGLFKTIFGYDEYAIWVGGIQPMKNQLRVIRALGNCKIPQIFMGPSVDPSYYQICKIEAKSNQHFIDSIPYKSEIFRSAVADAKVYMELSFDPPGASSIEAAISGCNLLLADTPWCREHFGSNAVYTNVDSPRAIEESFNIALSAPLTTRQFRQSFESHLLPNCYRSIVEILERMS
jgi:hypothetical protein